MKKFIYRVILIAIVLGAGYGAWRYFSKFQTRTQQVPVTRVRRGDVVVRSFTRGELRAVRTATLTAPNLFGTTQITKLAPLGSFAQEKNLIVEFDDSEVLSRLESRQLELEQFDEQIKKAQADLAIRNNTDQVDLLKARYSVRRAELEVKRNEILAVIDQKKNLLNLEEARRRLKQLESDIKSRQEQAVAELNTLRERRNRNLLDINREKSRLQQVKLLSPISGLVAVKQNRSGFSGMFGTQVPDFREGDQVPPGSPVADVLDLSELEIIARVGELDRANLTEGQDVLLRLDALPDNVFNGKIKSMSGTASANVFSSDPGKKFDVLFSIDMRQLLTTLGAKPDQVERILRTADENRKKPITVASTSLLGNMFGGGGPGGMPGGAPGGMPGVMPGGMPEGGGQQMMVMQGGPGGDASGQGGERRRQFQMGGPGGGGGMPGAGMVSNLPPEQQKKAMEIFQKATAGKNMMEMSQEERQAVFSKIREEMKKAGIDMPQRRPRTEGESPGAGSGQPGSGQQPGAEGRRVRTEGEGGQQPGAEGRRMAFGVQAPGGGQGAGGQGPQGAGGFNPAMIAFGGGQQFSQKDLDEAKLPPAPEESSQMEVLLRPGLLADVEIIVEKVPNAIYVPNQSVFESGGKPVVYVKKGVAFEARPIKIAKRSETVSVVSEGINPGDVIALSDPTAKPGESKKKSEEKKGSGAAGAMPGAMPKGGQQ